ncbi:Peptide chain release factor eRF1/aRF [Trema orientale]|uniref:Peptide chain release factor eRF1/aRF n=1 Tax=Trema orientale TaxID=63057 RepID=A0A2P5D602_TREOI|nr:Peptide chain release factor eRF1/aRF [Trema orientale]
MADCSDTDKYIEIWRMKKLVKTLEAAKGNGTSMISLIISPSDQVSQLTKLLGDEFGNASKIKSRVNRQSVLGAIKSAQQRLKLYNKVPPNGLAIYTGTMVTEDGKEKKVTHEIVPFKPINTSLYICDKRFHTEVLSDLLESDDKFGFIIMDGGGYLFGTLSGNTREVLHRATVDLPKKHGRGGQSALRFSRLRMESRHNYVTKAAEKAAELFIDHKTNMPNVAGLVLAGSADLKADLLCCFVKQKCLIEDFFKQIEQDTLKYVYGIDDTMKILEMGAIEKLIVWESLDINRHVLKNRVTEEIVVRHMNKEQEADQSNFRDSATSSELETLENMPLLEWLANEHKKFGCSLDLVTDKSQEGSKFCKGYGGIGGILRYQLDISSFDEPSEDSE